MIATAFHCRKPYQLLIIPLTIWSGIEQAFLGADFTAVGIYYLNYTNLFTKFYFNIIINS